MPHFTFYCELQKKPAIAGRPVVISYSEGAQKLVFDGSPELKNIQYGMPLQQAISIYGEIEVLHADIPYYWSVFNHILDDLELKSPLVEGVELGEVYIGIDGLQLLYPGYEILVDAVRQAIPHVFMTKAGIGNGKFPAYLAAFKNPYKGYTAFEGAIRWAFPKLPCDVLPVSLKSKSGLCKFGLQTLGQIAAMSPAYLRAQFGLEGEFIYELANGNDGTPLYPRLSEQNIEESTILPTVTASLDLLLMAVESLLSKVFIKLAQHNMGICAVTIWTKSWVAEHWEQSIRFKEPAMNIQTALNRIRQVIENITQPGPIEQLGMKVTGIGRPNGKQRSLMRQVRAQEHLSEEIKQLEMRLGRSEIYKFKDVEPWSRIPERRSILVSLSQ
jgi:DNA polymerase IV